MGRVVNGRWEVGGRQPDPEGRFVRQTTTFRDAITADGSSGFAPEPGRYHLYVSWACPWAHRTLILRKLKGLEAAISLSVVDHYMGEQGWAFRAGPGNIADPIHHAEYMHQVYIAADPTYTGRASVPVLWDRAQGTIVNNESREIIRMFDTACDAIAEHPETNFCPPAWQARIDETIDAIYEPINNGVYRSGFAVTQAAYEEAVTGLFEALTHWEGVLERQRYLCGDVLTEADWCLFTTLIRFDLVYHGHFKCNLHHIWDFPNLWNYLKALYQYPGVAETCNFTHIKAHYYGSHDTVNPTGVIPLGPRVDFAAPHDRESRRHGAH